MPIKSTLINVVQMFKSVGSPFKCSWLFQIAYLESNVLSAKMWHFSRFLLSNRHISHWMNESFSSLFFRLSFYFGLTTRHKWTSFQNVPIKNWCLFIDQVYCIAYIYKIYTPSANIRLPYQCIYGCNTKHKKMFMMHLIHVRLHN